MNLDNKFCFSKSKSIIICMVFIAAACILILVGCEKNDLIEENSTKEKISLLAERYGLDIDFNTINMEGMSNIESFEKLERAFQKISEQRDKGAKVNIKYTKSIGDKVFVSTNKKKHPNGFSVPRLKGNNNESMDSMDSWFYDLTWYDILITYDLKGDSINNISVNGTYTGLSLYTYSQSKSTVSEEDGIITFKTYGYETCNWNILGITFSETRAIKTSGTYNTNTGTGSVDLSDNGYWFHENK